MKRIMIVANGDITDKTLGKKFTPDYVICADGGYSKATSIGLIPDVVIGDFDSENRLGISKETKIIVDEDQDKTDLELAIKLALKKGATEIVIIGGIGNRMDHTLANLSSLQSIPKKIGARIVNEHNDIHIVRGVSRFNGTPGEIVSIYALTDITGLTYKGLTWGVMDEDVPAGWFGVSNKMEASVAEVSVKTGTALVFRVKE